MIKKETVARLVDLRVLSLDGVEGSFRAEGLTVTMIKPWNTSDANKLRTLRSAPPYPLVNLASLRRASSPSGPTQLSHFFVIMLRIFKRASKFGRGK